MKEKNGKGEKSKKKKRNGKEKKMDEEFEGRS